MPYHRIPRASLHEDIRSLEREHEIVTTIGYPPDDPEHVDVFTRYCGLALESEPIEVRA